MESINVVVDDEEDERPSSSEESQLNTVEPAQTDCTKSSLNISPEKSPSPTASDTTSSTSEYEDIYANQPKQEWVKHNHPPQQLLGTVNERRRLRSRVIQPNSEVANQVSYSCYLAQSLSQNPRKLMKLYRMKDGCLPCMMSSINSLEMMFGPWFPVLLNIISLVLSGFSRIK